MIVTGKKAIRSGITPIAPENLPLIFPWVTAIPQSQCDKTSISITPLLIQSKTANNLLECQIREPMEIFHRNLGIDIVDLS